MQIGFRRAHAHRKKEAAPGAKPAATSRARSRRSVVAGDGYRGGACRKGVVAAAHNREGEGDRASEEEKGRDTEGSGSWSGSCCIYLLIGILTRS